MVLRALVAATFMALSLSVSAQEKRTGLTTEDLDRAKALDAEFRELLAAEDPSVRAQLDEARTQLFEKAKPWEFKKGLVTLRKLRSRASVPLLIETLLVQAASPPIRGGAANALTLLTGRPYRELWLSDLDEIAGLAQELHVWWEKEKASLATDPEKMTESQIGGVVARLVELDWDSDRSGGGIPDRGVFDEELTGRMVPALLEHTKNRERRAAAGRLLGRIRVRSGAPELDAIAKDPKQDAGVRLGALLALKAAGEELHTAPLLEIFGATQDARVREDVIGALADVADTDRPGARAKLISFLDDPGHTIRLAALRSLGKRPPAHETARIRKFLFATGDFDEARAALDVLEAIRTPKSRDAIGEYLRSTLAPSAFNNGIRPYATSALGHATGRRWLQAGPHPDAYYMEQAKKALAWYELMRARKAVRWWERSE